MSKNQRRAKKRSRKQRKRAREKVVQKGLQARPSQPAIRRPESAETRRSSRASPGRATKKPAKSSTSGKTREQSRAPGKRGQKKKPVGSSRDQVIPRARLWEDRTPVVHISLDAASPRGHEVPNARIARPRSFELGRSLERATWRGVLVGLLILAPGLAIALHGLAYLGMSDSEATLPVTLGMTYALVGVPALLLMRFLGRASVRMSVAGPRGRVAGIRAAVSSAAVIGAGLSVLAAAPLGHVAQHVSSWILVLSMGALVGAGCGAILGLWVTSPPPRQ